MQSPTDRLAIVQTGRESRWPSWRAAKTNEFADRMTHAMGEDHEVLAQAARVESIVASERSLGDLLEFLWVH
jgi:hypothetical protein